MAGWEGAKNNRRGSQFDWFGQQILKIFFIIEVRNSSVRAPNTMVEKSSPPLIGILFSILFMIMTAPAHGAGVNPVEMDLIHFAPKETFTYTFPDGFSVEMKGRAVVRYTVNSPGLEVVIEQTPDLKNWIAQEPLSFAVVSTDETSTTYEAVFQIHGHPDTGNDKSQYFRVRY